MLRRREDVRRDGGDALPRHFEVDQASGARHPVEAVLQWNRRPERLFVAAADAARDVQAPGLLPRAAIAQRRERDAKFGIPAEAVGARRHLPARIPVEVEAAGRSRLRPALPLLEYSAAFPFLDHLAVVLDAR